MPKTATPSAAGPADFDEHTPPPRSRPCGVPAPRRAVLPAHDAGVIPTFHAWDGGGRTPAGAVLVEFVGTLGGLSNRPAARSPYRIVALGEPAAALPAAVRTAGVGGRFPLDLVGEYRAVAEIVVEGRPTPTFHVLAPGE